MQELIEALTRQIEIEMNKPIKDKKEIKRLTKYRDTLVNNHTLSEELRKLKANWKDLNNQIIVLMECIRIRSQKFGRDDYELATYITESKTLTKIKDSAYEKYSSTLQKISH